MRKLTLFLLLAVAISAITSCSNSNNYSDSLNESTDITESVTESVESSSKSDHKDSLYVEQMKEKARKLKFGDSLQQMTDILGEYDNFIDGNIMGYLYYLSDNELILCCIGVPDGVILCQYVQYKDLSLPFDKENIAATDNSIGNKLYELTENNTLEDVEKVFGEPTWIDKIQPGRDDTEYYVYDSKVKINGQSEQVYFGIVDNKLIAKYPIVEKYFDFNDAKTDSDL